MSYNVPPNAKIIVANNNPDGISISIRVNKLHSNNSLLTQCNLLSPVLSLIT
jgi:hypothetical protein